MYYTAFLLLSPFGLRRMHYCVMRCYVRCLSSSNSYHFTRSFALAIHFIVPCAPTHTHTCIDEAYSNFIIHSKVFGSLIDALQRSKFARSPHCVALRFSFAYPPPSTLPCTPYIHICFYFPSKFRACVSVCVFFHIFEVLLLCTLVVAIGLFLF